MPGRVERVGDVWEGLKKRRRSLTRAIEKLRRLIEEEK